MTSAWSNSAFAGIGRVLAERTGLSFTAARSPEAERGMRRAMERAGIDEPERYLAALVDGVVDLDELVSELTVGETYFFRDAKQFELLRTRILPELVDRLHPQARLRIWSAACASGEEAYSLAILLAEMGLANRAAILATDISPIAIERAHRARYRRWSFRGVDDARVARWFEWDGQEAVLAREIRHAVRFRCENLIETHEGSRGLDLVLCRNMLIYLDDDGVARVGRRLHEALAPGGWLLTGASDPDVALHAPLERILEADTRAYRRQVARPSVRAPADELAPAASSTEGTPRAEARPPTPSRPAPAPTIDIDGEAASYEAAREHFDEGRYAEAAAVAAGLADEQAAVLELRALANAGPAEQALARAAELAECHPLSPSVHHHDAVLLAEAGRLPEAVKAARRALYLDRGLAVVHLTLGRLLERLGDLAGAGRAYRNGHELARAQPPELPLPLGDGELAGSVTEAAASRLRHLKATAP